MVYVYVCSPTNSFFVMSGPLYPDYAAVFERLGLSSVFTSLTFLRMFSGKRWLLKSGYQGDASL
jgi:hypothetical protein